MGKTLITGATGFLGRHVVVPLLESGQELILAVRTSNACTQQWEGHDRIRIIKTGAIETATNLKDIMAGVKVVVHLAGLAHVSHLGTLEECFFKANALATERLAQAAGEAGVGTFIHMSSLAVVSDNVSSTPVGDDAAESPVNSYGRSKLGAEKHVLALAQKGVFGVSLRPPLIVGKDAKGNWHSLQRLAATGLPLPFAKLRNKRSMIGVNTLAEAIVLLSRHQWPVAASGNYCIANRECLSLAEIVTELRCGMGIKPSLVSFPPSILYGMVRMINRRAAASLLGDLQVNSSRFRETFGFEETQGLRESIRDSGQHYVSR